MFISSHSCRGDKAVPLKEQSSTRKVPGYLGKRQWRLRLCPAPLVSMAFPSLSVPLVMVYFGRQFILQLFTSCISDPRSRLVALWAWMSPWSLSLIHVSKLCLVPGTSLRGNLERISSQNRKKELARISFRLIHVSGGFTTGQIPKAAPLLGWVESSGGQWRRRKGAILLVQRFRHVVSKTSPLYLQNKVKLSMSSLAGDMFLWGKSLEKCFFFNFSLQSFLEISPTIGSPDTIEKMSVAAFPS